jgi:polysaccharide biosynthesis transport protein
MLDRPGDPGPPPSLSRGARSKRQLPDSLSGAVVLAILRRHKLALFVPMLLIPLLGLLAIGQLTTEYTATGTLQYDASEYSLRELQSILRADPITEPIMATQTEVLRGMPVIQQVATRLNLFTNPEFNDALRPPTVPRRLMALLRRLWPASPSADTMPGPQLDPARNATLRAVQSALAVAPVKSSRVLEVSFTSADPVLAAAAVNDAMDVYIREQLGVKSRAVHRAHDWLEDSARALRIEVHAGEDRIAKWRASHGLVEGMHAAIDNEQISHLTEELARARNDLAEASGRLDAAQGRAGAVAQAAIAPSVVQLRALQGQLSGQLQAVLSRLGPGHPDVVSVRNQLAEAESRLAAEIARVVSATDAEERADRERVATLEHSLADARAQLESDAAAQIPLNAMQRDVEASRTQLQAVLDRLQQISQQEAIESADAHEVSFALPPTTPSWPRTRFMMAGIIASSVPFSLILVYLFELADGTFRSGEDIRAVLGLPCLALIPEISRQFRSVADLAVQQPHAPFAEQLRALRTGLWLCREKPRVVAITAARPGEGKTTIAVALGRIAALNGERVVVLDCDFRKPALDRILHAKAAPGLVDCLHGNTTVQQVIDRDSLTNMHFIPAGRTEADSLGLLMSAPMANLLQSLRRDYDLVLLDTPPAQAVTDARIIASAADATLLCIHWRSTPRDTVLHALDLLEEAHANVVGAALTHVKVHVHVRSGYADAEVYYPRGGHRRERRPWRGVFW